MKRIWFIGVMLGTAVLSCTVVYPLVHEGGHYITARMLGVDVHDVVWTTWTGHPHVALGATPGHAIPWINAGGLLLPTFVGMLFALLWIAACKRLNWNISMALLVTAVTLLAGNLGTIAEALTPLGFKHMRPLAEHLGLSGFASIALELLPALVASVLIAAMGVRLQGLRRRITQPAS
ncbi:MAG: hypothetical protein U1E05_14300 [Patescibacteria group bacterium]|nr:hypothetical protein [Patescibacteria group bacterium]